MLKIYRYLATASAALLLLALVLVAWFYNQQATRDLVEMATRHSIAIDKILSRVIWSRYEGFLLSAGEMEADALRARAETREIAALLDSVMTGIHVLKVKIYSTDGRTLFSSDPTEIGEDKSRSVAVQRAVNQGEPSSKLSYKDQITAFSGELFHRDVVETYVPTYDGEGNILGVSEVYTDVTDVKHRIRDTTIRLFVGLIIIFAVIYAVLVTGIMRRAIRPIQIASRRAARIGPGDHETRLPTQGMPREILPLILAINDAFDRLDRALEAQRRFTSDAAHELLTPLALLQAEIDSLEDAAAAAQLRHDVDAMTQMVHQLLYLAELESMGEAIDGAEQADLHQVATDVVTMLAPLAIRERKELALTGAGGPLMVRGTAGMLDRVLRNLVENALRHTPENTIVELHLNEDGTLRVCDQGPGVPPDKRERVFERFWRGARRRGSGAGLGLSIVRRIVDLLGGEVWVGDAPQGGACFHVRLPRAEAPAEPEAPDRSREARAL